jgi:TonB family protein
MRENYRLYLFVSLAIHLCLVLLLFLLKGPQAPERIPRRVVIEFSPRLERSPSAGTPEQTRLPDLEPRELAGSLKMEGPKTLSVPGAGVAAGVRRESRDIGGDRLRYAPTEKPVLPKRSITVAPPRPEELLARDIETPALASPLPEENGITRAGALEWKGRERKLLKTAGIPFPDILLEEGLEVDVAAVFSVSPSGQVIDVDIVRSSGYASVDSAVERALLSYLFEASDDASTDVGEIQYRFRLERSD